MSAFLLTPRPFLRHVVAPSDRSPLIGPAPAQSHGAEVVPQVFSYLHPSSVGIRLCKCRSWLAMTHVKIQASNTSRNPLKPMRLEVMANSESVENCRQIEKPQKEAGTDSAMAGRAYADQRTGEREARRPPRVLKVAVIGAGAAGLVAARELEREGHEVVVYERSDRVGGVWNYSPEVEDDPLGIRHNRSRVHCSMYESLRTNLPRELMGFLDFPFLPKEGRDPRRFPSHEEVYLYLQDFAEEFGILQRVRFSTEVQSVSLKEESEEVLRNMDRVAADSIESETRCRHLRMDESDGAAFDLPEQLARPYFDGLAQLRRRGVSAEEKGEADKISSSQWVVVSRRKSVANGSRDKSDVLKEDVFDAVVVCNGHYSEPKIASIPGIEHWSGTVMHSHNYRVPTPFRGQVVVLIGCAASGEDISRELATVAQEVHICARSWSSTLDLSEPDSMQGNLWRHPMISCISQEGAVIFEDGSEVVADTIMHCTGYKYSFPFLERQRWISVEDNRVGPLFQHVFPPALAPRLSFVGLPYKVVPFPLCQLQSKWIAKILSGQLSLPSSEQMMTAVHNFYALLEAHKYPKHYTHNMDLYQYAYGDWLSAQCGYEVQKWREEMYAAGRESKRSSPTTYRDVWIDQQLMETVYSNLVKFQIKSVGAPANRCHDNVHVVT